MHYHCLHIKTDFAEEWQKDLFDQELCDLGVDTIDGEDYYIPTSLWEQNGKAIKTQLSSSHFSFSVASVEDRNWNAVWEAEHPIQELPLGVKIIPHCAFGAGHHETTSMMIHCLLEADISDKNVLDHVTGTGVLAIFAKRLGAAHVIAVDIDDKSVENAKENAALNGEQIEVKHTTEFHCQDASFHLILANIHRNILLDHLPVYAASLEEGGELWMSGFYETDCPALEKEAKKNGLQVIEVRENGEWRLMKCRKAVRPPRT